ncbi:anhydro-N-acetylmuramic acid kinase [Robertkochia flava]|uniref:anhydro-N-acetylmuramic acid kinase n=1 Tax=Robertkochia flava TaxID=3447986 RepID=UPI001CCF3541|nr:anhydro-N-acetylmuramic acid kinase [Robertkochia marina]
MEKQTYHVLGVMSGTSLDGIDIARIHFEKNDQWSFEIAEAVTIPYPSSWLKKFREAVRMGQEDIAQMDVEYTQYLAGVIKDFISENGITDLDAICSHGHTVFHQPHKGVTLQIGNRPELARLTRNKVVCDFRIEDVKLGGQGAPLVPVGDRLLFPEYRYCLNLGGFANVSTEKDGQRLAFDICAVNTVLNHYAEKLNMPYDSGGDVARSACVNLGLLKELSTLPFYKQPAPKSLGIEWVEAEVLPLIDSFDLGAEDVLATYTVHVADILADSLGEEGDLLVTGGGAYNSFLIEELRKRIEAQVVIPEAKILEYKEALIFGLLGVLRLREEVNCLSSVTGASADHSSGYVFIR